MANYIFYPPPYLDRQVRVPANPALLSGGEPYYIPTLGESITIKSYNLTGRADDTPLKFALLESSYTFSYSHMTWSDVSSHEVAASGEYTSNGVEITTSYVGTSIITTNKTIEIASAVFRHVVFFDATERLLFLISYTGDQTWAFVGEVIIAPIDFVYGSGLRGVGLEMGIELSSRSGSIGYPISSDSLVFMLGVLEGWY